MIHVSYIILIYTIMVRKIQFIYTISTYFNVMWATVCYHNGIYVPGFNNKILYLVHAACLFVSMTVTAGEYNFP
jgi:hypothetical protein